VNPYSDGEEVQGVAFLKIHEYGDQVLRNLSQPVANISQEHRQLIDDMIDTMYQEPGVGLAAPQVGINLRIIVIDSVPSAADKKPMALINPVITGASSDTIVMEEGCLSIPGFRGEVRRPRLVSLKALDLNGQELILDANEIQSRILQHEIDHLDGILFVDRLNIVRRDIAKRKLKKRLLKGEFAS